MDTVLLDACFIIGLRDCGKTRLLLEVAKHLSWKLVIPKAAYIECTPKDSIACHETKGLVVNKMVEVQKAPSVILRRLANRYPSLGKGELEALACALTIIKKKDPAIVITSDHRGCKVASELGIQVMTTLDFFRKVYELGLMTKKEMQEFIPTLPMWLSQNVIEDFLKSL